MKDNPTIFITGGAGFLGSHICQRLIAEGRTVLCVDNFLTSQSENISHLLGHPRFFFSENDVTQPIPWDDPKALPDGVGGIDYVLHLASPASPKDYAKHSIDTLMVGALGTRRALELARAHRATFLLASTSEVYGDPQVNPQPESYWGHVNPIGPRSMYDEAKRFAEALTMAYHYSHNLDVRIARIFNTYGPRMRAEDGRVLPNFINQALRGEPLTVYGDGSQTRSFCFVDDLVEGLLRLVGMPLTPPVVVNLGNPDEVTILELAEEVIEIIGGPSTIVFDPLPLDDPKVRRPKISRARKLLGWEPRVPRQEGLRELVDFFRDSPEDAVPDQAAKRVK